MHTFSIVVSLRDAGKLHRCIDTYTKVTNDIVLYDNGNTNDVAGIAAQNGARHIKGPWQGFGKTKNAANTHATYDWILSLDSDEALDEELIAFLRSIEINDPKTVYEFNFKTFLGNKWIRFGEWGTDRHIRMFNRHHVKWNDAEVHEQLILPADHRIVKAKGNILHYTVENVEEYSKKMEQYAQMNAREYFARGKKISGAKKYLSSVFSFLRNYIFRRGFLDGHEGLVCAKMTAHYTFLKYKLLEDLNQKKSA